MSDNPEKCPFCGAGVFWSRSQTTEYKCLTRVTETGLKPDVGEQCYKNQIAQLQAAVEEAKSVMVALVLERPGRLKKFRDWLVKNKCQLRFPYEPTDEGEPG